METDSSKMWENIVDFLFDGEATPNVSIEIPDAANEAAGFVCRIKCNLAEAPRMLEKAIERLRAMNLIERENYTNGL